MRELFDRLLAEGEAGIDRLVAERTQESVTLDFKEARGAGTGTLANEDRKTFAKALSAFANSAGGLLVFGVEARKGADDVDCAQAAKPIANIERFKSEATTASGQLLQPRHDGILVEAIPSQKHSGAGYLLVYVERSERRPHRSEAAGQKQYFKRAGDSSFEMEHYDIEDAFRRTSAPQLNLELVRAGHMSAGNEIRASLFLYLVNPSNTMARFSFLHFSQLANCSSSGPAPNGFVSTQVDDWRVQSASSDTVIHPGLKLWVASIGIVHYIGTNYAPELRDVAPEFSFAYRFGCENSRLSEGRFTGRVLDFATANARQFAL